VYVTPANVVFENVPQLSPLQFGPVSFQLTPEFEVSSMTLAVKVMDWP
jgi:hypothetical protein